MSLYVPPCRRRQQASLGNPPAVPLPSSSNETFVARVAIETSSLRYSAHAALRMSQRKISPGAVTRSMQEGHRDVNTTSVTYRTKTLFTVVGDNNRAITVQPNFRNQSFDLREMTRTKEAELLREVKKGNDHAMCTLGDLYLSGSLGEPNVKKAEELFLCAARKYRNSHAMCKLSQLYDDEDHFALKDPQNSKAWMMKAAMQGNQFACAIVGQELMCQCESEQDSEKRLELAREALGYLEKSAAKGSTRALWSIAVIYKKGWLGEPRVAEATALFIKAAKKGSPASLHSLSELVEKGEFPPEQLEEILDEISPVVARNSSQLAVQLGLEQIEETLGHNSQRGINMLEVATESGNEEAIRSLVELYKTGRGTIQPNRELALFWFEKLKKLYECTAKQGNVDALWELGELLLDDSLGTRNALAAERHFIRAAQSNKADYLYLLGMFYQEGEFGEKTPAKAVPLIQRAIAQWSSRALKGDRDAASQIGKIYCEGNLGEPNYIEAIRWLSLAADLNEMEAMYNLAEIYLGIKGAEYKDLEKGVLYIEKIVEARSDVTLTVKALGLLSILREKDHLAYGLSWLITKAFQGKTIDQLLESVQDLSLIQKEAMAQLAKLYKSEELGFTQYEEANQLFSLLATAGNRSVLVHLVQMYQKRQLQDLQMATKWAEALISRLESKEINALFSDEAITLGKLYKQGEFVQKNLEKATRYFCAAFCLPRGHSQSIEADQELQSILTCEEWTSSEVDQIMTGIHSLDSNQGFLKIVSRILGDIYSAHILIEKNLEEAIRWYTISADLGNNKAKAALEKISKEPVPLS